jgi:hypothetical protein
MDVEIEPFASEVDSNASSRSICKKVVHPKNLANEHVYIETSCTLKFEVVKKN